MALSQALHTYFAVSDIRAVSVEGLQGCRYLDTIDDWQQRHQLGALRFSGVEGAYRYTVFDATGVVIAGGETSDAIWQQLSRIRLADPQLSGRMVKSDKFRRSQAE